MIPKPTIIIAHVVEPESNTNHLVHYLFSNYFKAEAGKPKLYDIMAFGEESETDLDLEATNTIFGAILEIKDQIQKSNKYRPPKIIPGNKKAECFSKSEDPDCIVNMGKLR